MYFEDLDNLRQPALYYISGHEDPDGPWLILDWNGIPTDDDECRFDIISEHIRDQGESATAEVNHYEQVQDNNINQHLNGLTISDKAEKPLVEKQLIEQIQQNTSHNAFSSEDDDKKDDKYSDDDGNELCLLTVPPMVPNIAENRISRCKNVKIKKNQALNNVEHEHKSCIVKNELISSNKKQQQQELFRKSDILGKHHQLTKEDVSKIYLPDYGLAKSNKLVPRQQMISYPRFAPHVPKISKPVGTLADIVKIDHYFPQNDVMHGFDGREFDQNYLNEYRNELKRRRQFLKLSPLQVSNSIRAWSNGFYSGSKYMYVKLEAGDKTVARMIPFLDAWWTWAYNRYQQNLPILTRSSISKDSKFITDEK